MNRIRELRQQKGWTQDELANKLHMERQTIGHYETGERNISIAVLLSLCEIFGCSSDYILGRTPYGGLILTGDEESLILAYRQADERSRCMVDLALDPFRQKSSEEQKAI